MASARRITIRCLAPAVRGHGRSLGLVGGGRQRGIGIRRGEWALDHPRHLLLDLCVDGVDRLALEAAVVDQPAPADQEGIALLPALELTRLAVTARIAARVPDEAVGEHLEEDR